MNSTGDAASGSILAHGPALEEREASLGSDLYSASEARRLVRQFLKDIGRDAWVDAAELAISEVVTNAALHAHTPIEIRLTSYVDLVCVEVRDFNSTLPVQRNYDVQATTGRGMSLVAAITHECGVHPLGESGKVVWFCVGDSPAASVDNIPLEWEIEAWPESAPSSSERRQVVLASMPATLWLSARQHHDAILRELVLYHAEHEASEVDLAAADNARSTISNALTVALDAAHASGTARPALPDGHPSPLPWVPAHLDLVIDVPADTAWQFAALQDALDAGETLALEVAAGGVGRPRVVTVVPPDLREAHVAGFSRHLTTGEAHVLGVPLDLPVLRRDGSDVRCRFVVERAPVNPGRSVYIAWIEPLEPQDEQRLDA